MPNSLFGEDFDAAAEEAHLKSYISKFPSCDAERIRCVGKLRPDGTDSPCPNDIHFPPLGHVWGEEFDTSRGTCHVDHLHPLASTVDEFGKARSQAMINNVQAGGSDDPFSLPGHTGLDADKRSKILHLLLSFDPHPSYSGGLAFRCGHACKRKPPSIAAFCHAKCQMDQQMEWTIGQYVSHVTTAIEEHE